MRPTLAWIGAAHAACSLSPMLRQVRARKGKGADRARLIPSRDQDGVPSVHAPWLRRTFRTCEPTPCLDVYGLPSSQTGIRLRRPIENGQIAIARFRAVLPQSKLWKLRGQRWPSEKGHWPMATCRECGEEIPYASKTCPRCGDIAPFGNSQNRALLGWLAGGGALFLLWVTIKVLKRMN